MTAAGTAARPAAPAPLPLECVSCTRALGSQVAFCPFCGAVQQVAAPEPRPAPPTGAAVAEPIESAFTTPPDPSDGEPADPPASEPAPQAGRKARIPWRRMVLVAAALAIGALMLRANVAPAPRATLVVRVHAPNGAAVPGGRVLIDGREAGAPGESLQVHPGTLNISFAEPGWRSEAQSVNVGKDAAITVNLAAQELPGHLLLTTTPPGATVRIGGRTYGQSPLTLNLSPGNYEVSITLAGYVAKVLAVTLAHGETRNVSVALAGVAAPTPPPVRFLPAPFDRGVVTAPTPLQASPAGNADLVALLPAVSEVQVQARVVADATWLQVRADGRQGFIPANGAVEPWDAWAQRNTVAGAVDQVTGSLQVMIAGGAYPLAGVQLPDRGFSGLGLARVTARLDEVLRGVQVRCVPRDTASFLCKTAEGRDVAELYLLNGGAVVGNGALAYYGDAQRTAREKQRGLWSE